MMKRKISGLLWLVALVCLFETSVLAVGRPAILRSVPNFSAGVAALEQSGHRRHRRARRGRKRWKRRRSASAPPQSDKQQETPSSGAQRRLDPEDAPPRPRPTPTPQRKNP